MGPLGAVRMGEGAIWELAGRSTGPRRSPYLERDLGHASESAGPEAAALPWPLPFKNNRRSACFHVNQTSQSSRNHSSKLALVSRGHGDGCRWKSSFGSSGTPPFTQPSWSCC